MAKDVIPQTHVMKPPQNPKGLGERLDGEHAEFGESGCTRTGHGSVVPFHHAMPYASLPSAVVDKQTRDPVSKVFL